MVTTVTATKTERKKRALEEGEFEDKENYNYYQRLAIKFYQTVK